MTQGGLSGGNLICHCSRLINDTPLALPSSSSSTLDVNLRAARSASDIDDSSNFSRTRRWRCLSTSRDIRNWPTDNDRRFRSTSERSVDVDSTSATSDDTLTVSLGECWIDNNELWRLSAGWLRPAGEELKSDVPPLPRLWRCLDRRRRDPSSLKTTSIGRLVDLDADTFFRRPCLRFFVLPRWRPRRRLDECRRRWGRDCVGRSRVRPTRS